MEENSDARRVSYRTAMKEMFKQIPTTMTKPLSPRKKVHKLMKEIGGGWYMEKNYLGTNTIKETKTK